jgi:hypothetical protein
MRRLGPCPGDPPAYVAGNDGVELRPGAEAWWLHRGEAPQLRCGTVERILWYQGIDGHEPGVQWDGVILAPELLYGDGAKAREDYAAMLASQLRLAESMARAYRASLEACRAGDGLGDIIVPCQAVS